MSADKVSLHFIAGWGAYNAGDTAGFDKEMADQLVKGGVAEPAKAAKEAKPKKAKKSMDAPPVSKVVSSPSVKK